MHKIMSTEGILSWVEEQETTISAENHEGTYRAQRGSLCSRMEAAWMKNILKSGLLMEKVKTSSCSTHTN